MVADWRSDRPVDVAELRYEFRTGNEEIRAAYRTDMELVVLAIQEEMTATKLQADREYGPCDGTSYRLTALTANRQPRVRGARFADATDRAEP